MIAHLDYLVIVILFSIGLYALVMKSNLIKKLIGLNIMERSEGTRLNSSHIPLSRMPSSA